MTESAAARPRGRPSEADAPELLFVLHALARLVSEGIEKPRSESHEDPRLMVVLALLKERGPMRVGDIAAFLRLSPSATSRAIDTAVRHGLVRKLVDERDRRAAKLVPTPAGERSLKAYREEVAARVRRVEAMLTETERQALARVLQVMLQSVGAPDLCLHCPAVAAHACFRPSLAPGLPTCDFQLAIQGR